MTTITLPENYGAVIGVSIGAIPLLSFIHGVIVTKTRFAAGIPYPHSYATIEQCKENPKAERFNSAQRAHSNFLENAPQTTLSILVAGLRWPNLAAGLGAAWVAFRSVYLYGYVFSGKAGGAGRYMRGSGTFWLAQGALWGMAVFGVGWGLGF